MCHTLQGSAMQGCPMESFSLRNRAESGVVGHERQAMTADAEIELDELGVLGAGATTEVCPC